MNLVVPPPRKMTPEVHAAIARHIQRWYESGSTLLDIGEYTGQSRAWVRHMLAASGIAVPKGARQWFVEQYRAEQAARTKVATTETGYARSARPRTRKIPSTQRKRG